MKNWECPMVEELDVRATANGAAPSDSFDDTWVQIDGRWYRPGDAEPNS